MKNIAIITARSGSKGIKDKNIKELCGQPLMYYRIKAAIQSGKFDEIMVSTDSEKYAEIAIKDHAKVPFLRSLNNSSDNASSWDTVEEVLNEYKKKGQVFDSFCLLQPTSPLRTAEDIVLAYDLFEKKSAGAVVSVCETEHSPLLCGKLPEDNQFINFVDSSLLKRRQDMDIYYRINGAIYIVDCKIFHNKLNLYQAGNYAYIMPRERSVDIDSDIDIELARILLRRKNS